MAVSISKLNKLDKLNAATLGGEHLWVTVVLESGDELQGYFRHDAVNDTVSAKVPGRRGRLKVYSLDQVNDIEVSDPPASVIDEIKTARQTLKPVSRVRGEITHTPVTPVDNGTKDALPSAAKQLTAPVGVLCYLTGKPTDATRDVCLVFGGMKYFITRDAFAPVLEALRLIDSPEPDPVTTKRRPGRPAGSKTVARKTTARR